MIELTFLSQEDIMEHGIEIDTLIYTHDYTENVKDEMLERFIITFFESES